MCLHNMAPNLYLKLKDECAEHVKYLQQGLVGKTPEHLAYLRLVSNAWDRFSSEMEILRVCFSLLRLTH
jgi:hypothetical protein